MDIPVIQPGALNRRPAQTPVFQKVGIVGLGLIGGSIALAAREIWPTSLVIGVDNKDVLETAMRLHAIDVAADDPVVLAEADLVILAAPVRQNIELLGLLDDNVQQAAVITDVGSTKRAVVDAARGLPARFRFIGGHPLGGAAKGGLEHARSDLFAGRPWLLTPAESPSRRSDATTDLSRRSEAKADDPGDAVERLSMFIRALGAEPRLMDVATHDRLLAFLSHLPQLTASALMGVVGEAVGPDGLALSGMGLADTTRLASSPADIWRDIAATNADQIGPALDALIAVLQDLRRDLPNGDKLTDVFTEAERWRQRLPRAESSKREA
jgi:prephenate dehydrogenase